MDMEMEPLPSSEGTEPSLATPETAGKTWIKEKMDVLDKSLDGFFSTASTKEAEEGPSARIQNAIMKIWGTAATTLGAGILASVDPTASRPENTAAILGVALFATGVLAIQRAWVDSMKAKGHIKE